MKRFLETVLLGLGVLLRYNPQWQRKIRHTKIAVPTIDQPRSTMLSSKLSFSENIHDSVGYPSLMLLLAQKLAGSQRPEQLKSCSRVFIRLTTSASISTWSGSCCGQNVLLSA